MNASSTPETVFAPRERPVWLVVALSLVSFGLYTTLWIGLSWAELKRERGDPRMHPWWHALGFTLPVYGWFRALIHFRLLNEMLERVHSPRLVVPWAAFAVNALADVLALSSYAPASEPVRFIRSLSAAILLAGLAGEGQAGLNAYWRAAYGAVPRRPYPLEIAALLLGAIVFGSAFAGLLSGGIASP
ncbi:MAG: hypothetical protein IRZ14_18990 [Chloroflexi bacterium]|nr:hypothetical protein [Chloroflexota bacterium]